MYSLKDGENVGFFPLKFDFTLHVRLFYLVSIEDLG